MAPPDVDLLGDDADAGASTTLDESFADLDGSRPAQVPALGAAGAPPERDALDPPAAGGADTALSTRCAPLPCSLSRTALPRAARAAPGRAWRCAAWAWYGPGRLGRLIWCSQCDASGWYMHAACYDNASIRGVCCWHSGLISAQKVATYLLDK